MGTDTATKQAGDLPGLGRSPGGQEPLPSPLGVATLAVRREGVPSWEWRRGSLAPSGGPDAGLALPTTPGRAESLVLFPSELHFERRCGFSNFRCKL